MKDLDAVHKVVNEFSFRVETVPVAQPRQRHTARALPSGQIMSTNYTPVKHPVNTFKAAIADSAKLAMDDIEIIDGPIHIGITIVVQRPKALTREVKYRGRAPLTKRKGDNDNFEKAVFDAMQHIVFTDDCRIYSNFTQTWYAAEGESPHTLILVQEHKFSAPNDSE